MSMQSETIKEEISNLTNELIIAHDEYESGLITINDYNAILKDTCRKIKELNKRLYGHAMNYEDSEMSNLDESEDLTKYEKDSMARLAIRDPESNAGEEFVNWVHDNGVELISKLFGKYPDDEDLNEMFNDIKEMM